MHVFEVGLNDTDDDVIFPWALREERVVITSDADFSGMLALSSASGPSVMLLRSSDYLTATEQGDLILATLAEIETELQSGAVASVRPGRLRVRALPISPE